MSLRRALFLAVCAVPIAAIAAQAQFQPAPQQQAPQQQQQVPPCVQEFIKLRNDTEKKAGAIRAASARKAPAQEACKLFVVYSAAEAKMLKYAVENQTWCGIPAQIVEGIKKGHTQTDAIRVKVCQAAAQPARPTGPSLSDALNAPVADSSNIKTGRGTFDTLTGSPLGPK